LRINDKENKGKLKLKYHCLDQKEELSQIYIMTSYRMDKMQEKVKKKITQTILEGLNGVYLIMMMWVSLTDSCAPRSAKFTDLQEVG